MGAENASSDLQGPKNGNNNSDATRDVWATGVSGTSKPIDCQSGTYFGGNFYVAGFCRLICSVDLYYFWSDNASATASSSAVDGTNPQQQCDRLPAGVAREEKASGRYLIVQGGAAGTLHVSFTQSRPTKAQQQ